MLTNCMLFVNVSITSIAVNEEVQIRNSLNGLVSTVKATNNYLPIELQSTVNLMRLNNLVNRKREVSLKID